MLYLDYSREPGEWIPNVHGGRENLEAIAFLREMNTRVFGDHPGATTIAEESTAWPQVSRPVDDGGLGFGYKWNMGWMHDTLEYMKHEPVHRKYHHGQMTFGILYGFSENFVLPLSHDEVVHGKGSLLGRMPGDRWQKFANLRAYLAFMWTHPGKKLLFMGGEFAQEREWNHDRSLDWHLLGRSAHRGVQDLVRDLNRAYREIRRPACQGRRRRRLRVAGGRRRRAQRLRLRPPRQRRRFARGRASATSRRSCARATASACRGRAAGASASIPIAGLWRLQRRQSRRGRVRAGALARACGIHLAYPSAAGHRHPRTRDLGQVSQKEVPPHVEAAGRAWPVASARRHLGRGRGQFRPVLGQRHQGRGLPVRSQGPARDRARRAARIHPRGLARLSARRPARASSTAIVSTAPTIRPTATASIPTSCSSTPTPARSSATSSGTTPVTAIASARRAAISSWTAATSAFVMPKCQVIDTAVTWGGDRHPRRPWADTIIYEAHVKGMTAAREDIAPPLRGTFAGLCRPAHDRASAEARRHRHRADADPGVLRRSRTRPARPDQLLGLQHRQLLRAGRRATFRRAPTSTSSS